MRSLLTLSVGWMGSMKYTLSLCLGSIWHTPGALNSINIPIWVCGHIDIVFLLQLIYIIYFTLLYSFVKNSMTYCASTWLFKYVSTFCNYDANILMRNSLLFSVNECSSKEVRDKSMSSYDANIYVPNLYGGAPNSRILSRWSCKYSRVDRHYWYIARFLSGVIKPICWSMLWDMHLECRNVLRNNNTI